MIGFLATHRTADGEVWRCRQCRGFATLAVITHGQPFPGPFFIFEKGWSEAQTRLAALSTNSLLIRANKSNHVIQVDEAELVVGAIRRFHAATKLSFAHDRTSQE